jgi:uncharacterized low-complexity protein
MKILKLSAFILSAVLFLGLGTTTLSAEGMKCGSSMKKPAEKSEESEESEKCVECKKDAPEKAMKCGASMNAPEKTMKCGDGKCGDEKVPKKAMKCGTGKCGSN